MGEATKNVTMEDHFNNNANVNITIPDKTEILRLAKKSHANMITMVKEQISTKIEDTIYNSKNEAILHLPVTKGTDKDYVFSIKDIEKIVEENLSTLETIIDSSHDDVVTLTITW